MVGQWIASRKALEIVPDDSALLARLKTGLLKAKARLLQSEGQQVEEVEIGAGFWVIDRYSDHHFDWKNGAFANCIDGENDVRAMGV